MQHLDLAIYTIVGGLTFAGLLAKMPDIVEWASDLLARAWDRVKHG